MWPLNRGDCLIQVVFKTGLAVLLNGGNFSDFLFCLSAQQSPSENFLL